MQIPRLVEGFTRVKDLETGKIGTLESNLSTQITMRYDDPDTLVFFMKKWYGHDWEILEGE